VGRSTSIVSTRSMTTGPAAVGGQAVFCIARIGRLQAVSGQHRFHLVRYLLGMIRSFFI
jgi:hypothetical protein